MKKKEEKEEIIQLRSITLNQTKEKIFELLKANPGLDYYDISKTLDLDIENVIEACQELMKEGAIGKA